MKIQNKTNTAEAQAVSFVCLRCLHDLHYQSFSQCLADTALRGFTGSAQCTHDLQEPAHCHFSCPIHPSGDNMRLKTQSGGPFSETNCNPLTQNHTGSPWQAINPSGQNWKILVFFTVFKLESQCNWLFVYSWFSLCRKIYQLHPWRGCHFNGRDAAFYLQNGRMGPVLGRKVF